MGVKRNFGYNLLLTVCNYLFPLMVYPYISRVLQVENIGICNFIDSIINYFTLFSLAGISSYGVREIARCKDNQAELDSKFTSLLILNILLTVIALVILIICIYTVPQFKEYSRFLWIGSIKLIFSVFLIEWFYQGIEQFKFITIRTLIVRSIFVVSVFIFVHKEQDVIIYFLLLAVVTIINSIINFSYSRKYVSLAWKGINLKKIFFPVATFGYYRILTSLYVSFNTVFLGFVSTQIQVGYFSTASKLNSIAMSLFTAFTTVMIPHISKLIKMGDKAEIKRICNRTVDALLILALPLIFLCFIYAPEIIYIISGDGYQGAIVPFRIIIVLLLVIGLEQIFVQQFLMASPNSNKKIMTLSTIGAVIGISLNLILTDKYASVGSSISWVCSEIAILTLSYIMVCKEIDIRLKFTKIFKTLGYALLYIPPMIAINMYVSNGLLKLTLAVITVIALFVIINLYFQSYEQFPVTLPQFITKHLNRKEH